MLIREKVEVEEDLALEVFLLIPLWVVLEVQAPPTASEASPKFLHLVVLALLALVQEDRPHRAVEELAITAAQTLRQILVVGHVQPMPLPLETEALVL
jgi:hypothetical protein